MVNAVENLLELERDNQNAIWYLIIGRNFKGGY